MKKNPKAIWPVESRMSKSPTSDQIKVLLEAADREMRPPILLALTTGQRIRDLAALRGRNVDLAGGAIQFRCANR